MTLSRDYVLEKAAGCYYEFTNSQVARDLGVSAASAKERTRRLRNAGLIATPVRSFNVIVPPHYMRAKAPPVLYYIDQLMKHLEEPYYVGLLSAAKLFNAAHQRPQLFQVMVRKARAPITCGWSRIQFTVRKDLEKMPVRIMNTERGTARVSTPEVTAFELVGHISKAGGIDNVATVLSELSESIKVRELAKVAKLQPMSWSQRLGYLFEFLGQDRLTRPLASRVKNNASAFIPLIGRMETKNCARDSKWKLIVNSGVDPEV